MEVESHARRYGDRRRPREEERKKDTKTYEARTTEHETKKKEAESSP